MDIRCQQFTSLEIADEMLDLLDYRQNLYGKTVLENSCGEGAILCLVVKRYIQDALEQGYTHDEIILGLERDIYGAEIVVKTYEKCIENLNNVTKQYGLGKVRWNIFCGAPYISYKNLDDNVREFIRNEYSTCKKGKPDYCYAFIENAIRYLADDGSMVYLIPNSIYKNVYAQDLRKMVLRYIEEIRDYPNRKLFKNAMTSSAIMLLKKRRYVQNLEYRNVSEGKHIIINKEDLSGKWIFDPRDNNDQEVRFGDFFKASMAVATQRNKIFVISESLKNELNLERGVLREAVSPRNQKNGNREYIIFPYMIRNDQVLNYSEAEFRTKYPKTYSYLLQNRDELDKRDADKCAQWFEFGRSQALQNMNKEKLLVSTVVTNSIYTYNVRHYAIPYAGIYIISPFGHDLEIAKSILESEQFFRYICGIGTPASGKSLRITARDINEFKFRKEDFSGWER